MTKSEEIRDPHIEAEMREMSDVSAGRKAVGARLQKATGDERPKLERILADRSSLRAIGAKLRGNESERRIE